jgi:hypothetical protein
MILNFFSILAFLTFYLFFFLSFYFQSKRYFIAIYLILSVFHDFIFINAGYHLTAITMMIIKSWQEILSLFLITNLTIRFVRSGYKMNREFLLSYLIILILTMSGIVGGILTGTETYEIFLGWRKYILVLLNSILLHNLNAFKGLSFRFIYQTLIIITVIVIAYALYQESLFREFQLEGLNFSSPDFYKEAPQVLSKFWFYDRFDSQFMLGSWPNYIRDGSPRITSIFVGPIILSQFLAIVSSFSLILLIRQPFNNQKVILKICFLLFIFLGMWKSHTRIGFLQVLIGIGVSTLLLKKKVSPSIYWTVTFCLVAALFLLLSLFDIGDESAQGRLPQYQVMIQLISILGLGFGSPLTISYDSWYISIILLFGGFSFFYLYLNFYWIKKLFRHHSYLGLNKNFDQEFEIIFSIVCSFIFAFAFQASMASAVTTVVYLLLFMHLSHQKASHPIKS